MLTKRFVYVLQSAAESDRYYVGLTSNVAGRIEDHNAGRCLHTTRHKPWRLVASIEFTRQDTAVLFEKYLKTGSGRAFAKRHFV